MVDEKNPGSRVQPEFVPERVSLPVKFDAILNGLSPLERSILALGNELIERHRVLDINELSSLASSRLKHEQKTSVWAAINSLVQKKIIFHKKAITRQTLLENENRKRIYEVIVNEPGIHFNRIRSLMELDYRTVALHVEMLAKFGLIRSEQFDNNVIYFDTSLGKDFDNLYYYLHKEMAVELFQKILEHPGLSFKDLYETLGLAAHRTTLLRKITTLVENGFLTVFYEVRSMVSITIHPRFHDKIFEFIAKIHN